jgi:hypothetical protein
LDHAFARHRRESGGKGVAPAVTDQPTEPNLPGQQGQRDQPADAPKQPSDRRLESISAPPPKEDPSVNDQLDVAVHDSEVLAEIEMMTNLIIATSESDGPLPQLQIDEILGVAEDTPPV